mgnify:FL=1
MILKVQLSIATSMDADGKRHRQVLVYDKSKEFLVQAREDSFYGIKEIMGDRLRAYFEAKVVNDKDGNPCIVFGEMLPDQSW